MRIASAPVASANPNDAGVARRKKGRWGDRSRGQGGWQPRGEPRFDRRGPGGPGPGGPNGPNGPSGNAQGNGQRPGGASPGGNGAAAWQRGPSSAPNGPTDDAPRKRRRRRRRRRDNRAMPNGAPHLDGDTTAPVRFFEPASGGGSPPSAGALAGPPNHNGTDEPMLGPDGQPLRRRRRRRRRGRGSGNGATTPRRAVAHRRAVMSHPSATAIAMATAATATATATAAAAMAETPRTETIPEAHDQPRRARTTKTS
jgi:hypothetical protein